MLGKLSFGIFILSMIFFLLSMFQGLSGYFTFSIVTIGVISGIIGGLKKDPLSKTGLWTNAIFLVFLILLLYIPLMLFGG
ncbi:hypothetical protein [Halobacillus litoralis]|uniref:Uncharacterized protein n=1 Tax=Halobacillus litoralis TaxID=45668 RepID=A0A410MA45_9BACI|nr:hypothetical protein [Halobacillus litoralis]QAS51536.1 hypothetical protein HLI_04510 [Halobacillus litoralis]